MAILIDADVLLQAERGLFNLEAWLRSHGAEEFKLAAITVAELAQGAESTSGARQAARQVFLRQVLASLEVAPYDSDTARIHGRVWAESRTAGRAMSANDLILAAIAIQTGYALATFNWRRFAGVKGLNVIAMPPTS